MVNFGKLKNLTPECQSGRHLHSNCRPFLRKWQGIALGFLGTIAALDFLGLLHF